MPRGSQRTMPLKRTGGQTAPIAAWRKVSCSVDFHRGTGASDEPGTGSRRRINLYYRPVCRNG